MGARPVLPRANAARCGELPHQNSASVPRAPRVANQPSIIDRMVPELGELALARVKISLLPL